MIETLFIDRGSDSTLLKSLQGNQLIDQEEVKKAIDKSKLVQVEVSVHGKHGTHVRKQWKLANEVKADNSRTSKASTKDFWVSTKGKSRPDVPFQYIPLDDPSKALSTAELNKELLIHYNNHKDKYKCSYAEFRNGNLARKFVESHYFVSNGLTQTQDFYKQNGEYTPERKKLHNQIIKKIVDNANKPPEGQKPVAILMGGGSASGKGTIRKSIVLPTLKNNGIEPGISDSDDIKEQLPEYKHFQNQLMESAAYRVHEESSEIADMAVTALIKEGKNLMLDGTMKNPHKYSALIDRLHEAGYEVQIVGADVPLDVAYERSDKRALEEGRKVPHSIIEGSHGGFALTLPSLIEKVDSSVLYDNTGSIPRVIMQDGKIKDELAYETFLQKGETHKANKELRNLAREFEVDENVLRDYYSKGASVDELKEFLSNMGKEGLEEL